MADVNLSVAITSTGIVSALNDLKALREQGIVTAKAMAQVGLESVEMTNGITRITASATAAGKALKNEDKAFTDNSKNAGSLTRQLRELNDAYTQIGRNNPGSSAAQRLALGGGAAVAEQVRNLREANNPDIVRDLITVERQELAVKKELAAAALAQARAAQEAARGQAALAAAQSGRVSANLNVARANEDLTHQAAGFTAVQRAEVSLTRAEEDLARATKARQATAGAVAGGAAGAAQITARNNALNAEAAALRGVYAAQEQLTGAQDRATTATDHFSNAFQSSFSYGVIAAGANKLADGLFSVVDASIAASSQIQRSFADVDRTFDGTDAQLSSLKQKLFDLSTTTPNSFVDLSTIAALGNQLGIAAENIESFTTTLAQYSAVSGIAAEDAATAFGQIANLTGLAASQYGNLASSIEYVARTSVATESTIQNTSKEITALASGAGFSAQAIVGLAGTLSSLAIPPERARGALSLYFGALNSAVAEGGPKLEAFATLTGKSADEITKLVEANKGQDVFTSFIQGLSQLNTVAKTTALDSLGLSTIRVDQTMRALSQNVPLLTSTLAGANSSFAAGTEVGRQYAIIQETLASKFIEFQNGAQNAAAAVGDALAPALLFLLQNVTDLVVAFTEFAQSPFGHVVLGIAAAVAVLVAIMATLAGALAAAKVAMVIVPWAISGLEAGSAAKGVATFVAQLFNIVPAATAATTSLSVVDGVLVETEVAAVATSTAIKGTRIAMLSLGGVGIALAVIGTLAELLSNVQTQAQAADAATKAFFGGTLPDLTSALQKDTAAYQANGTNLELLSTKTKASTTSAAGWVSSLEDATGAQVALGDNTTVTTSKINRQTVAYGENAKQALATSLANTKGFQNLFKDTPSLTSLTTTAGFNPSAFAQAIVGGPEQGKKAVKSLVDSIAKNIGASSSTVKTALSEIDRLGGSDAGGAVTNALKNQGIKLNKDQIDTLVSLSKGYQQVSGAATAAGDLVQGQANKAATLTAAQRALGITVTGTAAGFDGATSSLTDYQDAIQGGLSSTLTFSAILSGLGDKNQSIGSFSKGLKDANTDATTFFTGIGQLAASGKTSFATQLAALGPEAQSILSGALKLSPQAQATLEQNARFAAFLASDAFKKALDADMENSDEAYARIFSTTGNLSDVQSYIAAQVAGTSTEWEKQWDANHPDLPLNVDIKDPTAEELRLLQAQYSNQLTITAQVTPVFGGFGGDKQTGSVATNTITDKSTGASLVLPASLDQATLNASVAAWLTHENATPEELAAELEKAGLTSSLLQWVKSVPPVNIYANFLPTASSIAKIQSTFQRLGANPYGRGGGEVGKGTLAFAKGGGYGQFSGGGTGTSDSLLARVSRGEFINTADSTNYWGPDFFDSLNRKMLPTSFVNMLGAAARSGQSGPTHVANVQVTQVNPLTKDPLKQLRNDSEMVSNGIWGDN